jgi:hypothetical protein
MSWNATSYIQQKMVGTATTSHANAMHVNEAANTRDGEVLLRCS